MKKLMIAAAIVCAAAVSQAAKFNWSTDGKIYGVDETTISGNGVYAIGGDSRIDQQASTATYTLTLYSGGVQVGDSVSGDVETYRGAVSTMDIDYTAAAQGTAYTYDLVVTMQQDSLTALGVKDGWDYSGAYLTQTISGPVTTEPNGNTDLPAAFGSWTVAGEVEVAPVPEPTSGLLLLLGVAGLALKRRHV